MLSRTYWLVVLVIVGVLLAFRPGAWLIDKPAVRSNPHYVKGWSHGCASGANSFSVLYPLLVEKPYVRENDADDGPPRQSPPKNQGPSSSNSYEVAWNEGYTVCRFYQASVVEFLEFVLVIVTMLCVGFRLTGARKP